jgi:PAS domain S-box-containing protein
VVLCYSSVFAPPSEHQIIEFLLFVFISGVDVAIAILLSKLIERLIIQQRNIRVLLEAAPNGFVLVDENGTIRLVNASAEKLFGYRREELVGKKVEKLVPEQHVSDHRNLRAAYQEKPEVRLMGLGRDLSGRRKDGSEFPVEIGLNPVGRDAGCPCHRHGYFDPQRGGRTSAINYWRIEASNT